MTGTMSLLKDMSQLRVAQIHYISQHFCGSSPSLDCPNVPGLVEELVLAHVEVFRDDF